MKIGSVVPNIVLKDQKGKEVSLEKQRGKYVVLYFYPKDDSAGCTMEAKDFTFLMQGFKELNSVVIGISPDTCESHANFSDKHNLNVTLLADPYKKAIEAYGVWVKKTFMGKPQDGVERSTFLIDKEGKLIAEWRGVDANGHAAQVLAKLKSTVMQAPMTKK